MLTVCVNLLSDLEIFLAVSCSLLKEAQPLEEKRIVEMGETRTRHHQHLEELDDEEGEESEEHQLLSRYGIWLMVELCKPKEDVPIVCDLPKILFVILKGY